VCGLAVVPFPLPLSKPSISVYQNVHQHLLLFAPTFVYHAALPLVVALAVALYRTSQDLFDKP
jgi:hypothetical protein